MTDRAIVDALLEEEKNLEAELAKTLPYQRLVKVRELLAVYGVESQALGPKPAPKPFRILHHPHPKKSRKSHDEALAEAEKVIVEQGGGPVPTATIYAILSNRGVEIGGKEPRNTLSARLSNAKDRFVSHGRSGWTAKRSGKGEAADDESSAAYHDILG